MADMNYVSPLTSDLTDYYTKSEVDELQQGDAATYATSAEIVAGDNAVKGWVVSQGFLTEHQDLTNYATIKYVDDAIAAIEPSSGGMAVRVVNTLPSVGEENVLYLVFVNNEDEDNRYAEYVWVDTLNDYEMLGFSSSEGGIIPDLTDYATKQWVEAKGYLDSSALTGYATVSDLADFATKDYVDDELANKANAADLAAVATTGSYNDLSNKPAIPDVSSLTAEDIGYSNPDRYTYAQQITNVKKVINFLENRLDETVKSSSLATVATSGSYNDLTDKPTIPAAPDLTPYATKQELTAKADAASLATVATSGDYDDLTNKPTIPILPTLATVATSGSYNDLSDKPTIPEASPSPNLTLFLAGLLDANVSFGNAPARIDNTDENWVSSFVEKLNSGEWFFLNRPVGKVITAADLGVSKMWVYTYSYDNNVYSATITGITQFTFPSSATSDNMGSSGYCCRIGKGSFFFVYGVAANIKTKWFLKLLHNRLLYDNTTSGLSATTIQGAIDELAAASGGGSEVGWSYDSNTGYMTFTGMILDDGRQEVRLWLL